jgi:uncharacterized protein YbaR (Trm112 family)
MRENRNFPVAQVGAHPIAPSEVVSAQMAADSIPGVRGLRFPAWQDAFEAALQTTDTNALFKLVEVAEAAILVRRDVLSEKHAAKVEERAIDEALHTLLLIKRHKLRFPIADTIPRLRREAANTEGNRQSDHHHVHQ